MIHFLVNTLTICDGLFPRSLQRGVGLPIILMCWAIGVQLPDAACVAAATTDRPNIMIILADDMGYGDMQCMGSKYLKTPHLDKMSAEGVTFDRFYSAAAMCSPTRGSCYTGRNPYRFGITYAMKGRLEDTEIPITSVVKKAGLSFWLFWG